MHHDFYELFHRFWWLVFPLFWMVAGAARLWSRHARANRVLDLVKSYVDQGKEPPPELLKVLQGPFGHGAEWRDCGHRRQSWVPVFLFAALALGFTFLAWTRDPDMPWGDHGMGLIFVAIIMAGLCLGSLVSKLARRRDDAGPTLPK